jgi:hypothetical protein
MKAGGMRHRHKAVSITSSIKHPSAACSRFESNGLLLLSFNCITMSSQLNLAAGESLMVCHMSWHLSCHPEHTQVLISLGGSAQRAFYEQEWLPLSSPYFTSGKQFFDSLP